MAFTIPNQADAGDTKQAEVDSIDIAILVAAIGGTGVVSGCAVTAQGTPDMTVAVASGAIHVNGSDVSVSSGNVTIAAADATNPRFDLLTVNSSGTKADTTGTPAASPVFPAIPANSIVLAAIYVPANATTITSSRIIDKRAILSIVPVVQGGTGATTAQDAINTLTAVAGATNEYVLTKDTATGNATFKVIPASSSKQMITGGFSGASTVNNYSDISNYNYGATESLAQTKMPLAGTLKNFYLYTSATQTGGDAVLTIRKNGVDTTLKITVTNGSGAQWWSDLTHTVSVAVGDLVSMQVTTTGVTALRQWVLEFDPS